MGQLIQSGPLWLYVADARDIGMWADPQGGAYVAPHAAADASQFSGAAAVLDGPMFDHAVSGTSDASSTSDRALYGQRDASRGLDLPSAYPSRGATLSVVNGVATVTDGWSPQPGATVAVQGYPALLRGGQNVADNDAGTNGQALDRAGIALMSDGRVALVIAPYGIDMVGFADATRAAGGVELLYTDGGGSGSLQLADGTYHGASEHRRVATWITAGGGGIASIDWLSWAGLLALLGIAGGLAWWAWETYGPAHGRGVRRNPARVRARLRRR